MFYLRNNIKLLFTKCQHLQNLQKRRDVLPKIVCLQDTHWTTKDFLIVKESGETTVL